VPLSRDRLAAAAATVLAAAAGSTATDPGSPWFRCASVRTDADAAQPRCCGLSTWSIT
jgi:hypothetical protein